MKLESEKEHRDSRILRCGALGLGALSYATAFWTLANDLRWGPGWYIGPAAGGPRGLAHAAILETIVALAFAFASGIDQTVVSRRIPGVSIVTSTLVRRAMRSPLALVFISCVVAAGSCRSWPLWGSFFLVQIPVVTSALLAATLGVVLNSRLVDPTTTLVCGAPALAAWCCTVFLAGPFAGVLSRHPWILQWILALDPLVTVTRYMGVDHLRGERIYRLTDLGSYPFRYPPAIAGVLVQVALAAGLSALVCRPTQHKGDQP
jgi:hypothetical protein